MHIVGPSSAALGLKNKLKQGGFPQFSDLTLVWGCAGNAQEHTRTTWFKVGRNLSKAVSRRIGAATLVLSSGFVAITFGSLLARPAESDFKTTPQIVFVEAPKVVSGELTKRFPEGSRVVRLTTGNSPQAPVNLTPGIFAAADPQVSFDGSKVLFSAEKARGARWQVWEMNSDGSGQRQITHSALDCLRPAYLPQDEIVYTAVSGKGNDSTSALYVSKRDGSDAHPITFGPGNFQIETVLQSGRLLVSAQTALVAGGRAGDSRTLYILRTDGTGLTPFRQDPRQDIIREGAGELGDGTVLFVERTEPARRKTGGSLAWIRPGSLHNSLITQPKTNYWSAHELEGETLVVAKKDSAPAATNGRFDLYAFNLQGKTLGQLIYRNPKLSSVQAVPLMPHPVPKKYWSILHPSRKIGRVICLNSYLSTGAPHGRLNTPIARVRVITLQPDHQQERVLGDARVEKDGSFYIEVPADHPIRFELLNAQGGVIRAQRSWVWVRTGEDMGCLGCHENKAQAPPNHWPVALEQFDTPIAVGVAAQPQSKTH